MVDDAAQRGRRTVARVLAPLVATGQVRRALGVGHTLGPVTPHLRVSRVLGQAVARPRTCVHPALGVDAALRVRTRVDALSVHAGLGRGALGVGAATDCDHNVKVTSSKSSHSQTYTVEPH
jgi:hypothetical protein